METQQTTEYLDGYAAASRGVAWDKVPYAAGTREFHLWLEGHSDGVRGLVLERQKQHPAAQR